MTPSDPELYNIVKNIIYQRYKKNSAFRSGAIIKMYKSFNGKFEDDNSDKPLKRWYSEKWQDVNPLQDENSYPVFRPTKRINKKTPLTVQEIEPENLIKQSKKKQIIKGNKNLEPFISKGTKK